MTGPETGPGAGQDAQCALSERQDRLHAWKFEGDDPYTVCVYCDELRDALTGQVLRKGES